MKNIQKKVTYLTIFNNIYIQHTKKVMKKIILSLLVIMVIAMSCNGPSKSDLQKDKETLLIENAAKDKQMNDLVNTLLTVDSNLNQIREKEGLIEMNMRSPENNSQDVQERINSDIQSIYELMIANKKQIAELEHSLNSTNSNNAKLNSLILNLNKQLKEKSNEILALNEQLSEKNLQITTLNFTVEGMSEVIDSIRNSNQTKQSKLDSTTTELYTAYYAFGTKKELKEHNVISSDGLPIIGKQKVLNEDFNEDYFTKVDTREVETIPLFRPKYKILTTHPAGSYEVINEDEDTKTIKILDKDKFWSISKFLVVQVN